MQELILDRVYANQARLELSNAGQPLCRDNAFADGAVPMDEKFLFYIGTMNPLHLWIIQFSIIMGTATLLSFVLREIRQPKVIAEVLSGIVLGPTICGRIPGFTEHLFPPESRPYLALTADIGLRLFFFLFGLQIEPSVVKKNLRVSGIIALAGMIIPFVTGAGLSVLLYEQFMNENIRLTYFMFFSGVAFSVTAFPVMCRILTEFKLLNTTVGAAVISAGLSNDVIGWILLALSVAMLKADSGSEAMYMILSCAIWTLILLFPVKLLLRMLATSTGSIDNGPSVLFMTIAVLIAFSSALVTNISGVHGIFGAFLMGLIIPREGNLATSMLGKLEDMVEIIFLPFYFALLGMSTNLGFLNDGITWVYTILIIFAAFVSKFGSCAIAAKYIANFSWRESGAIGSFMSCKGLVELIVLDVGLSAGILTPRVYAMFVLEALVLTFMTTPLAIRLYPPEIHKGIVFGSTTFRNVTSDDSHGSGTLRNTTVVSKRRITVVLDKVEHLPAVMAFTQLFGSRSSSTPYRSMQKRVAPSIEALRLIEISERACAVMKSPDTLLKTDHLLAILKMFGRLHAIPITTAIDIATYDSHADSVIDYAYNRGSDLIVLPWHLLPANISHRQTVPNESFLPLAHNGAGKASAANVTANLSARIHPRFLQSIFEHARADVALFLDRNIENSAQGKINLHLFLPFFGGPDDRLALDFVAQLCENDEISATVVRFIRKS
ncbi:K(+)/H(+) antiporter 1, partial [Termitomyces sp. T112]